MSSVATRRWLRVFAGLALVAPITTYAAVWFGIACYAAGGLPATAAGTVFVIAAVGVLIWRWRPERRDRVVRIVVASVICLSIAIAGMFIASLDSLFSGPGWDTL